MTDPARPSLATTLRKLRLDAGLSGIEAARRAGLSQPTISRLETGHHAPTPKQVAALCKAYRVDQPTREYLMGIAHDLEQTTTSARIILSRPEKMQQRIGRIEQSAETIRAFQPAIVIGLCQTSDYATAMAGSELAGDALTAFLEARSARLKILDTHRRFIFLHTEGALHWHIGSPEIMVAQLRHLAQIAERPNIEIPIIPSSRPIHMPARHAFHIFDSHTVTVSTESGTAIITDHAELQRYEQRFRELYSAAASPGESRGILSNLERYYRSLTPPPV